MITPVFRRRSEHFARLLDEATGDYRGHSRAGQDDDLVSLVTLSRRVEDLPLDVQVDDEFRTGLRAALMATIEREGMGATAVSPDPTVPISIAARHRRGSNPYAAAAGIPVLGDLRGRRTRTALIVGLATGALALSGMSAASGDAVPGDALYSVKRSAESAKLALTSSDDRRGELYLEFAKTRISEAGSLADDPTSLPGVLDDLDSETRQGTRLLTTSAVESHNPAPLDIVDQFVVTQLNGLRPLAEKATGEGRSKAAGYATLLQQVHNRVKLLRAALDKCAKGTVSNSADGIGPRPSRCAPVAGAPKVDSEAGKAKPSPTATDGTSAETTTGPDPATTAGTVPGLDLPTAEPSASGKPAAKDKIVEDLGRLFDKVGP
jgi:hypothetical protein